jgi:protein phosphatase
MTEDHKIANYSERLRIEGTGEPLKEGETRLYGMKEEKSLKQNFPALYNFEIAIC